MAGKKGTIPKHVKQKIFIHPQDSHPLIHVLTIVEDPRKPSLGFRHSLVSVLFMTLVAVVCGASDWEQIVVACEGMQDWLSRYVDMSAGIPCERTFKNIFAMIKPESLEEVLREFSSFLRERVTGEVICFDGQTCCGTADKSKDLRGIHLLNAWSARDKICLGQLKIDDKSNEIPAMPRLLDLLDVNGAVITADAMNTQKKTVSKIVEKGADYTLPIKENQETLFNEIKLLFIGLEQEQKRKEKLWNLAVAKAEEHRDVTRLKKLLLEKDFSCGSTSWTSGDEKGHGRIERRTCIALAIGDLPAKEGWENIQSVAQIIRERTVNNVTQQETVYYISSLSPDAQFIAQVIRDHWGIENSLHWRLDVHFGQDDSRYRERNGAANMAIIRKMALNLLSKEKTLKKGAGTKQQAAACNPLYREKVLKNLF